LSKEENPLDFGNTFRVSKQFLWIALKKTVKSSALRCKVCIFASDTFIYKEKCK
jgi:hypothetical protein